MKQSDVDKFSADKNNAFWVVTQTRLKSFKLQARI